MAVDLSRTVTGVLTVATFALVVAQIAAEAQSLNQTTHIISVEDISPDQSSLAEKDADGASGGRVNGIAISPDRAIVYATSEWGGLYESRDLGDTWQHVDAHVPNASWRVKVNPANAHLVYATSFYDGRVNSVSGINVSIDGGVTWNHPNTAAPPPNFCRDEAAQSELSAYEIAVDPADSATVYIGTNCGIAISRDAGIHWTYVDPTPGDPADSVWSLVAHQGIVDSCGDDGHARSVDGGRTWTPTNSLPSGRCSLAASPDEANVLFAVVGTQPYESDDAGAQWRQLPNPGPQGRIPFVKTNKRSATNFDLWFGDVTLYRIPCTRGSSPDSGAPRCPDDVKGSWEGPFTRDAGGHDDTGDIAFDNSKPEDNCPLLMSSDGGVYINSIRQSPACQNPKWRQPTKTPHGLWVFDADGIENEVNNEDVYFGNQDNGTFGTRTGFVAHPSWFNSDCCDSFSASASNSLVLYTSCCYGAPARSNQLFVRGPGLVGGDEISTYPPGDIPGWESHVLARFGPNRYVILTTVGVYYTPDISAKTISWVSLGQSSVPDSACGIYVSNPPHNQPTFFLQTNNCDGRGPSRIYRLTGTTVGSRWRLVQRPFSDGGFGVFAVDPKSPLRWIASYVGRADGSVSMIRTSDGGIHWTSDRTLDALMTGNGEFRYRTISGPTDFTSFDGYPQPTLVAFSPSSPRLQVAGGADSGLMVSVNGGEGWESVRLNGRSMNRPRTVSFAVDGTIFVGSEGSGIWRIKVRE